MDDLVTWLRRQLDEDERVARATIRPDHSGDWTFDEYDEDGQRRWELTFDEIAPVLDDASMTGPSTMRHIARHDPARVLREVQAKRRIVNSFAASGLPLTTRTAEFAVVRMVLRLLALPYADRPGFREEWRP